MMDDFGLQAALGGGGLIGGGALQVRGPAEAVREAVREAIQGGKHLLLMVEGIALVTQIALSIML